MRILVTGTAGFIGNALSQELLRRGDSVAGLDNLNDYYDVGLKEARLALIKSHPAFVEARISLENKEAVAELFATFRPERVVHLAAQVGVRYSVENPHAFVQSNVVGFLNILEECRRHGVEHLVFASSSSVYGANTKMPFSEHEAADHPLSLYAATKRANELMAHSYSHLYGLPATGLRFFTVYGPWGRPDMALFKFANAIVADKPIPVFNQGNMRRDFTYIDDIVGGVLRVLDRPAAPDPGWRGDAPDPAGSAAPFRVYNIGNNSPVALGRFIDILEECLGRKAKRELLPMQPGDLIATAASVADLEADFGFKPETPLEVGIARFVAWYKEYYGI